VSVQLSPVLRPEGQAPVMPSERPTVWHWRSRLVQTPEAHARPVPLPPEPPPVQDVPSDTVASAGQSAAEPVQRSGTSHSPTEGRQTVVEGLKAQLARQQVDEAGSQTAPLRKRQAGGTPDRGAKAAASVSGARGCRGTGDGRRGGGLTLRVAAGRVAASRIAVLARLDDTVPALFTARTEGSQKRVSL